MLAPTNKCLTNTDLIGIDLKNIYLKNNTIGVFDSGIGGISVLNALVKCLPNNNYLYIADQAYLPYGTKSNQIIVERVLSICKFLAKQCDVIVIACNTATALAIDLVRPQINIPIIGIEPAIKPAALATKTGYIALCATQNMLESARLDALIAKYGAQQTFYKIPCPSWVSFVESGLFRYDLNNDDDHINNIKKNIKNDIQDKFIGIIDQIDQIILGCTHFPFLRNLIEESLDLEQRKINLIDPAMAIAARVSTCLSTLKASTNSTKIAKVDFYSTQDESALAAQIAHLKLEYPYHCHKLCRTLL